MVNYYLYFPEEDHEVLESKDNLVERVYELANYLKGKNEVYYDEANIEAFIQKNGTLGTYLASEFQQLRIKLFKIGAKSININPIIKRDCIYVQWNIDSMPTVNYAKPVIADLAERSFQFPDQKLLLINLDDVIATCREKVLIFKDAKHIADMPSAFAKIDFVTDAQELEIWQNTYDKDNFTLLNRTRFRRTSMVQQGKPVFEEIESGNYWYLDNFHKNEYEVFDHQHNHIGVADLKGVVNEAKKVDGRVF